MKSSSQTPRTPAKLADSLHRQLNMYALAATAAGVGALAMAQPAQAKIVYTPTHQKLPINKDFFLDLNHDGVNDFQFYVWVYSTSVGEHCIGAVNLSRLNSANGAVGKIVSSVALASALKAGVRVGKTQYFPNQTREIMGFANGRDSGTTYGPWTKYGKPVDHRYLGLKFETNGKTHYGWARLNVWIRSCRASATLTGYAYETVANKPIITGKTKGPDDSAEQANSDVVVPSGMLGRLALGRK
jgi:hypothetical protein